MAADAAATQDQTPVALSCRRYSFQAERQLRERRQVRCIDPACRQRTDDGVLHDAEKCHRRLLRIEQTRADHALIPAGHQTIAQCNQTQLNMNHR